jgi:hypothetical protein
VFAELSANRNLDEDNTQATLYSQSFRENIRVLLSDIEAFAEISHERGNTGLLSNLEMDYDLGRKIERSWHMCEIFFLSKSKFVSLDLARWLKGNHLPVYLEQRMQEIIDVSGGSPESSSGYWDLISELAMQGRLDDILGVLQLHSQYEGMKAQYPTAIADLESILQSHPFASITVWGGDLEATLEATLLSRDIPQKLRYWQQAIKKFQSSQLMSRMPHMFVLFDILLGDKDVLFDRSEGDWTKYGLSLLLYVYPPPLLRTNIAQILEEAVEACRSSDIEMTAKDSELQMTFLSALQGDVGLVLKDLYETAQCPVLTRPIQNGAEESQKSSLLPLAALASTGHLTYLLIKGGGLTDLLEPLPDSSAGCAFPEELLLQIAECLNDMYMPPDVIAGYLSACPTRGSTYIPTLLSRRNPKSDSETQSIAKTLREHGCSAEAREVEVRRGMYWFNKQTRPGLVRAAYFYQLAADSSRTTALIERTLWGTACAVRACVTLFPGLKSWPIVPALPFSSDKKIPRSDLHVFWTSQQQNSSLGAMAMDTDDDSASVEALIETLEFAEDVLSALRYDESTAQIDLTKCLRTYCTAIRKSLRSIDDGVDVDSKVLGYSQACRLLCDLVLTESAPMRFWFHFLELAVSLDSQLKDKAVVRNHNGLLSKTIAGLPVTSFSKIQSYAMMNSLARLETVYTRASVLPMEDGNTESADEAVQLLRQNLLGIYSNAVIQENADANVAAKARVGRLHTPKSRGGRAGAGGYDMLTAPRAFNL